MIKKSVPHGTLFLMSNISQCYIELTLTNNSLDLYQPRFHVERSLKSLFSNRLNQVGKEAIEKQKHSENNQKYIDTLLYLMNISRGETMT